MSRHTSTRAACVLRVRDESNQLSKSEAQHTKMHVHACQHFTEGLYIQKTVYILVYTRSHVNWFIFLAGLTEKIS